MKTHDLPLPAANGASPEVYNELGRITRQLHDALTQLGVMPKLQQAADGLPDAKSRLNYIARKTADAAGKVLDSVDGAKGEHAAIAAGTRRVAQSIVADPVRAVASGLLLNFVEDVDARTARIDAHLTDIMLAQDFHDLTGQVVAKVVGLASELEESLVKLLVQVSPASVPTVPTPAPLNGPVVDPQGRSDVVQDQGEVDDLLASLGF